MSIKKYWDGVKFTSIAAKGASLYIFDKEKGKKYIFDTLSKIPGISTKISQILELKMDLPKISNSSPALSLETVKGLIEQNSPNLIDEISEIDPNPVCASLSQVHRATLKNNDEVAIKVQYPNIEEDLLNQLSLIFKTANLGSPKKYGLDLDSFHEYFLAMFTKELDYKNEAMEQTSFYKLAQTFDGPIVVPRVVTKWSSDKILVQAYEHSVPINKVRSWWPLSERYLLADNLFKWHMHTLIHGFKVHADMHSGNYGFNHLKTKINDYNNGIVLYDFGSILKIDPKLVKILIQLIHNHLNDRPYCPYDYFCAFGFDEKKLSYIATKLPALMNKILDPFSSDGRYHLERWQLKSHFDRILDIDKWWFRSSGPPWFLMLMRSFYGVFLAIEQLDVGVPFKFIFTQITKNIPLDIPIKKIGRDTSALKNLDNIKTAKLLKVKVWENGSEKVHMTLPARALDEIESLLPIDAKKNIEEKHDISNIKFKAQNSGYLPQILFEVNLDKKFYKVWLE